MAPKVFDSVFSSSTLKALTGAGAARSHSFTTVFDREAAPEGRTIVEAAIATVLQELDDDSRYVEYWWRGTHKNMEVHRDVDEALCRSRKHAGTGVGVQRCPEHGHVLYLDLARDLRGPTCVFEEQEPDGAWVAEATAVDADVRAGPPRPLRSLHVVPAQPGRLLSFRGDLLHAVPKPALDWLPDTTEMPVSGSDAADQDLLRSVLLFNTWQEPPMLPSPKDPPPDKAVQALEALDAPPACTDRDDWREVAAVATALFRDEAASCLVEAPLLGDALRRGCEAPTLQTCV